VDRATHRKPHGPPSARAAGHSLDGCSARGRPPARPRRTRMRSRDRDPFPLRSAAAAPWEPRRRHSTAEPPGRDPV